LEVKQGNLWKWLIKLTLSVLAIWWITRKIDFTDAFYVVRNISATSLVAALVLYNLSQMIGSARLKVFLADSKLRLRLPFLTALYYRGMFYNLFLPGGIGGDGYKIFILHRKYDASVKTLVKAHIFDRLSGLIALLALFLLLMLLLVIETYDGRTVLVFTFSLLLIYPAHLLLLAFVSSSFMRSFLRTSILSLILQGAQLLTVYVLLTGLGVDGQFVEYGAVFLLSSVATVIPVTLGGLGAREMTFVLLAPYTSINPAVAVAFSLLFFLLSTISSLPGIFIGKFDTHTSRSLHPV
jgi:glycosyltransferase 2 family protein